MGNFKHHTASQETATDAQIEENLKNLHTALPCVVLSFNANTQTVSLSPLIKQLLVNGEEVTIPPLLDVPVSFPRGGGFAVTFPLQAGDEGLAVFSERCIDGWHYSGRASQPLDFRLHDLSDALFFPGICSLPKAINGFFTGGLSLQTLDGKTFIRVSEGKITIKGDIQQEGSFSIVGDIQQEGNFSNNADVIASGISLVSHTHGGVSVGAQRTSTP